MSYTLEVENARGERLMLTGNETQYQIIDIEGLTPPAAVVNTTVVATLDGEKFNSVRIGKRNIVINVRINGDVEKNRNILYRYCGTKQYCKIYYTNSLKSVYAEGWVEAFDGSLFEVSQIMQISIICPLPYWKGMEEIVTEINKVIGNFEFPFAIEGRGMEFSTIDYYTPTNIQNNGQFSSGVILTVASQGEASGFMIQNTMTGDRLKLNFVFQAGDSITINTNPGSKSIMLRRDGKEINIINSLDRSSKWIKLEQGDNIFVYLADAGMEMLNVTIRFYNLYEGV